MFIENFGEGKARSCDRAALLQRFAGLFGQQFLKSIFVFLDVVGQIHHAEIAYLLEFPRRRLRLETETPPFLGAMSPLRVIIGHVGRIRDLFRITCQVKAFECSPMLWLSQVDRDLLPLPQQGFGQCLKLQERVG